MAANMAVGTALSALDTLARCGRYARWLYDLAAPHLGRSVVEVGAGLGTQSRVMLEAPEAERRRFLLTDSDPARVKSLLSVFKGRFASRSNMQTAVWSLPDPFPSPKTRGREFGPDTFVGWNVLEHVEDDTRALAEMGRALQPGGKVVMLCPAGPGLMSALDRRMGHFRRYARRELPRKAARAGLEPVLERRVNMAGAVGWFAAAKLLARKRLPETPSRLFDLLVPVFRLWEDRLPVPWGSSVLFVAEKA